MVWYVNQYNEKTKRFTAYYKFYLTCISGTAQKLNPFKKLTLSIKKNRSN